GVKGVKEVGWWGGTVGLWSQSPESERRRANTNSEAFGRPTCVAGNDSICVSYRPPYNGRTRLCAARGGKRPPRRGVFQCQERRRHSSPPVKRTLPPPPPSRRFRRPDASTTPPNPTPPS